MEIQGKIIVLNDTETIGTKDFKKRLVVIQTDEQYPQTIPVEFTQDKTSVLNFYKVGDLVKIGINIRGSEWKGRYFANINGWKIDKIDSTSLSAQQQMPDREAVNAIMANAEQEAEEDDDLPF
jgi:hypothetical protein